jgi:DNA-3-methyladenine glycosylase
MPSLQAILATDAATAAKRLLGCVLEREIDGQVLRAKIVETEAYDQSDPASHSFAAMTNRTATMFGPAGHSYVYFTYGMHFCCNIVTGTNGFGGGVLLRAVEPLGNEALFAARRGGKSGVQLTNGPGKLCQALGIDRTLDGHDLEKLPLRLIMQPALESSQIVATTRVGITKATDTLWRFYIKDSPYVSGKRSKLEI